MYIILLALTAVLWALNMGATNFAISFSPSVGSKIIKKNRALILFAAFVLAGAVLIGGNVVRTLSGRIIPKEFLGREVVLIILFSAGISLHTANFMKIPVSTSITIVGSFVGAGMYFGALNYMFILKMVFIWVSVGAVAYFLTYYLTKLFYPPTNKNLWIYEKLFKHEEKLKKWTLYTDCYSAFGDGSNNVPNVVGPLVAVGLLSQMAGFWIFAPLFALGAFLFGRGVLSTVSEEIIPLGVLSSSVVSLMISSFTVFCSLLGIPAPNVVFSAMSILGVQTAKEESKHAQLFIHPVTKKILMVWLITPLAALFLTYITLSIAGPPK